MSYSIYCGCGSNGTATVNVNYQTYTVTSGSSISYSGFTGSCTFTATPNSGYEFDQWVYHLNGSSSTTYYSSSNPLSFSESQVTALVIAATFKESGGGGGGNYHYACYDNTNGSYISGYSNIDTTASSITRPSISGYTYKGYVYYDSYANCIAQGSQGSYDGTGTTCSSHSSSLPYVVFFYEYEGSEEATESITVVSGVKTPVMFRVSSSGSYTMYTSGSLDTIGYLTYASVTSNPESNYIAYNDDGGSGTNFSITSTLAAGDYKIWVGAYSGYSGTTTLHISPKTVTFRGDVTASGETTAYINAQMNNGASSFAYYRYVRLMIGSSWYTGYIAANEQGGASNTFTSTITGLSSGTTYSYTLRLYYNTGGGYVDTGYYINGSFTTTQSASGMMIYVNGWKNAVPYIYTSSGWKQASSRMYINGWKGS